ncbi:hypothetical protein BGW80DRAFT_1408844 [Lactifluus volemus]|nr:hypothetical protein BGW80DRAFT_1408844 [Lactifluus volemus]
MPLYDSIDDITSTASSTVELRRLLGIAANEMLEGFLRKWIDTMLAKLFARGEKMTDLYALLEESEVVILPQVEPVFHAAGQYSAL